jgi:DNA polymerase
MKWVVLDFETASSCGLKQSGAWRYAEDPSTEILCLCYSVMGEPVQTWFPGNPVADYLFAEPDTIFIAHNAGFEKAIWRHIMVPEFGFLDIPNKRWHDTMAVCAHKALPMELEEVLNVLRIPAPKDMEGRKVTLGMSKPGKDGNYDRSQEKRLRAAAYCEQDVRAEVALHQELGWLPPGECNVWLLNQRTNERGLRLDMQFVRAAQKIVDEASGPLLTEFAAITGGLKPSQGKKFLEWLGRHGLDLSSLAKENVVELIGTDEGDDDENYLKPLDGSLSFPVHRSLRIRQLIGSASIKKLKRMELCVSCDGRARGLSQYHGTAPGRAAGRLLQPYNFPRGTLKIDYGDGKVKSPPPQLVVDTIMSGDYRYVQDTIGPAIETVASSLRHALVPDPGRVFLSGDYAGIQARVVLSIAGQFDKTTLMASGADVYCDMAGQIYKRHITKNDLAERQTGKNSVLGLGFQMGWQKFKIKYAKNETDEFCENVVRVYRKEWAPKVPFVWYGLGDAATKCVHTREPQEAYGVEYRLEGDALSCRLPSGRKIWYQFPRATREVMPWTDDEGGQIKKPGFRYHANKNGRWTEIKAFGGLLTENVVMGIEVDIQRHAQFLCEKAGFPVVLEVYDEIVVEPEIANADEKAFEQILLDVEPWVKTLQVPIAVETWCGDRYRK